MEEALSQEFRLKNNDETRIHLIEEINKNVMSNKQMSECNA